MRLLHYRSCDKLSLEEFVGNTIPPYAILSHTWGADTDEVTFSDLMNHKGEDKPGYNKIRFCAKQVIQDNLDYFWIDTCCIDKTSSVELSEAINSMFKWYQNAAKCYVFLSDVSRNGFNSKHVSFQDSRWFTRGWTLQELLTPQSVDFFSFEGDPIGDKVR